jgi:hypothetical protein
MDPISKKENYKRFSPAIRIISAILVVAFFVQDLAWAHPDALQIELKMSGPQAGRHSANARAEYNRRAAARGLETVGPVVAPQTATVAPSEPIKNEKNFLIGAFLHLWYSRTVRTVAIYAFAFTMVCAATDIHRAIRVIVVCLAYAIPVIAACWMISWIYDRIRGKKAESYEHYEDRVKKLSHKARLYFLLWTASLPGPLTREPAFSDIGFFDREYFGNIEDVLGYGYDASIGDALTIAAVTFGVFTAWYFASYIRARGSMSKAVQGPDGPDGQITSEERMSREARAVKLKSVRRYMLLWIASGATALAVFLGLNYIKFNFADVGALPMEWAIACKSVIYPCSWAILYLSFIFFNSAISRYLDYRRLLNEGDGGIEDDTDLPPAAPPRTDPPPDAALDVFETPPQVTPAPKSDLVSPPVKPVEEIAVPLPEPAPKSLPEAIKDLSDKAFALGAAILEKAPVAQDFLANIVKGKAIILYADDILERGAVGDLSNILRNTQALDDSTILIYGRMPGRAQILEKLITEASVGKSIDMVCVELDDLSGRNVFLNIGYAERDEEKELQALLNKFRSMPDIKNRELFGVIKGATNETYIEPMEAFAKRERLPVISFVDNEGIYSFESALSELFAISNDGISSPEGNNWYRTLKPAEKIDAQELYNGYIGALNVAIHA